MALMKVAHGGEFSHDMQRFSYLEIPELWAVGDEEKLETWKVKNPF